MKHDYKALDVAIAKHKISYKKPKVVRHHPNNGGNASLAGYDSPCNECGQVIENRRLFQYWHDNCYPVYQERNGPR